MKRPAGPRLGVAAACLLGACAAPRTLCPLGTELGRYIYSGGAEAEWCRRPDGVREGPETRSYESGAEMVSGGYLDGAQSGVWRYRFTDGRNWRAERWDDGALVQTTVDPAVAHLSAAELAALGTTSSAVIKTLSNDPLSGRQARQASGAVAVAHYPDGHPRAAGRYDAEGLRTGVWQFWFEDGRPAREVEFLAGVRERTVREWHPNGAPAVEGAYRAGLRDGRWRFWDPRGALTADLWYRDGVRVPAGGMLPAEP